VTARFVREPDEAFTNDRARSFRGYRVLVIFGMLLASAAVVGANMAMEGEPVAAAAGVGGVVFLSLLVQVMLSAAQGRVHREQQRMQNLWMSRRSQLTELAGRDELTQLQNRRFFYEQLQQEMELAERYKRPLSILMLDVDDLKLINDEFGHQVGDMVLANFARVLNTQSGNQNITARLGGDEFAVIMPGADRRDADKQAWAIWEELSKMPICETENATIFLGVSIGTGGYPWGGTELEDIIHWADTKMYANKLERKGLKNGTNSRVDQRLVGAVVDVLSSALDVRDKMTHRHARRVARMSAFVAREMKLTDEQVVQIEYAAALHDIGKIGVADSILRKTEALDEDEWTEMRKHSELGYQILNGIDFLHQAAEIVHSHHERYDGDGYPRGLKGEEINLGARVFTVVDAYDAMTSRRPYRAPITQEEALDEIERNGGTQFDPVVVEAFLKMIRRHPDGFRDENDEFGSRVVAQHGHEHEEGAEEPLHAEEAAPSSRSVPANEPA